MAARRGGYRAHRARVVAPDLAQPVAQDQPDAGFLDPGGDVLAHVGIERRHRRGGMVEQGHGDAAGHQRFGRLQADVARADHDGVGDPSGVQLGAYALTVAEAVHLEHAGALGSWHLRDHRDGAGRDDEVVVGLGVLRAGGEFGDPDLAGRRVDRVDPGAGPDVDLLLIAKHLGGAGDQGVTSADQAADPVRDPAGGERGIGAALECDDLQQLGAFAPARLGCRGHSRRVAADHDQPGNHSRNVAP